MSSAYLRIFSLLCAISSSLACIGGGSGCCGSQSSCCAPSAPNCANPCPSPCSGGSCASSGGLSSGPLPAAPLLPPAPQAQQYQSAPQLPALPAFAPHAIPPPSLPVLQSFPQAQPVSGFVPPVASLPNIGLPAQPSYPTQPQQSVFGLGGQSSGYPTSVVQFTQNNQPDNTAQLHTGAAPELASGNVDSVSSSGYVQPQPVVHETVPEVVQPVAIGQPQPLPVPTEVQPKQQPEVDPEITEAPVIVTEQRTTTLAQVQTEQGQVEYEYEDEENGNTDYNQQQPSGNQQQIQVAHRVDSQPQHFEQQIQEQPQQLAQAQIEEHHFEQTPIEPQQPTIEQSKQPIVVEQQHQSGETQHFEQVPQVEPTQTLPHVQAQNVPEVPQTLTEQDGFAGEEKDNTASSGGLDFSKVNTEISSISSDSSNSATLSNTQSETHSNVPTTGDSYEDVEEEVTTNSDGNTAVPVATQQFVGPAQTLKTVHQNVESSQPSQTNSSQNHSVATQTLIQQAQQTSSSHQTKSTSQQSTGDTNGASESTINNEASEPSRTTVTAAIPKSQVVEDVTATQQPHVSAQQTANNNQHGASYEEEYEEVEAQPQHPASHSSSSSVSSTASGSVSNSANSHSATLETGSESSATSSGTSSSSSSSKLQTSSSSSAGSISQNGGQTEGTHTEIDSTNVGSDYDSIPETSSASGTEEKNEKAGVNAATEEKHTSLTEKLHWQSTGQSSSTKVTGGKPSQSLGSQKFEPNKAVGEEEYSEDVEEQTAVQPASTGNTGQTKSTSAHVSSSASAATHEPAQEIVAMEENGFDNADNSANQHSQTSKTSSQVVVDSDSESHALNGYSDKKIAGTRQQQAAHPIETPELEQSYLRYLQ